MPPPFCFMFLHLLHSTFHKSINHISLQKNTQSNFFCGLVPQRCLQFDQDCTVWNAKQQIIQSLSESLWDVYNYGLFLPAGEGRDAKFLEEERTLRDYAQSFEKGVPYLEVSRRTRWKRENIKRNFSIGDKFNLLYFCYMFEKVGEKFLGCLNWF